MTENQMKALSAAAAAAHRKGLTKTGRKWSEVESPMPESFDHRTIMSLVDRGLLKLWVRGTCAHATDTGIERWLEYKEDIATGRMKG